jgi:hypothetical protein
MNLNDYKKRFNFLLESELGDVNPFIFEQTQHDITKYPSCVQGFGKPTVNSANLNWGTGILGKSSNYDWTGYFFYDNYTVMTPNGEKKDYFCKGTSPMLGKAASAGKSESIQGGYLKIGSQGGDQVKQIQNRLASAGKVFGDIKSYAGDPACANDVNKCDGKFGLNLANAVKIFQKSAGIKDDGIVGAQTWQILFGGEAPTQPRKDAFKLNQQQIQNLQKDALNLTSPVYQSKLMNR